MKSKRLFFIVIAFIALAQFSVAAFEAPEKLVVTNSKCWSPYSFINKKGEPDGLFTEIWRDFARINNIKVEFKLVDWDESLELMKSGQADVHSGLFWDDDRSKFLEYGPKLAIPMPTNLIMSKKLTVSGIKNIGQIRVGVVKAGFAEAFFKKKYSDVLLVPFKNRELLLKALINEKILAVAIEYPTAFGFFQKFDVTENFNVIDTLYDEHTSFAVAKGNQELLGFVLNGMKNVGFSELDRIIKKWVLAEYRMPTWVWYVSIAILGVLITAFIAFYIHLLVKSKHELELKVAQRTSELTKKNEELQAALNDVKALSGILPICASCKKIRDSEGYWKQVEAYISEHSAAQFSHGLCKPCAKKLYGDEGWFDDSEDEFDE